MATGPPHVHERKRELMDGIENSVLNQPRPKPCHAALVDFFEVLYGTADDSHGRAVLYRKTPHLFEEFSPGDVDRLATRTAAMGEETNIYNLVNLVAPSVVEEIKRHRNLAHKLPLYGVYTKQCAHLSGTNGTKKKICGDKRTPELN